MNDSQHYPHDTSREIVLPDSHGASLAQPQYAETIEVVKFECCTRTE